MLHFAICSVRAEQHKQKTDTQRHPTTRCWGVFTAAAATAAAAAAAEARAAAARAAAGRSAAAASAAAYITYASAYYYFLMMKLEEMNERH